MKLNGYYILGNRQLIVNLSTEFLFGYLSTLGWQYNGLYNGESKRFKFSVSKAKNTIENIQLISQCIFCDTIERRTITTRNMLHFIQNIKRERDGVKKIDLDNNKINFNLHGSSDYSKGYLIENK